MNLSPTRLRLIRSIGLLLMLAASVAGFMLLIDLLADTTSQGSDDLLAETESDNVFISLPSSASLFALGVAAVALVVALAVIASPSNWRRSEAGLPRPRWLPFGIAASIALIVGVAGLFLAFSDSSPLFQQEAGAGSVTAEPGAAGHQVYTKWIAPGGVVILAAFFFTVILIGFLKPRLILPVLALWLVAGLFFGFFSSGAIAGLSLFNPIVSLEAPDAYAAEVARHRTVVIPPEGDSEGSDTGSGVVPPAPIEGVADNESDELGEGVGGVGDIGQDAPGEVSEEALIARLNDARNPYDRADAAEALPEHGSDEALRALAYAALYDPSQIVRDAALDAIGEWDFETLVEILQEYPEANVRRAAAAALGRLQDLRAVEPLATALLTDEAAEVRQESAKALRRLGDTEAVSALIQSLREDAVEDVRAESAEALGVLGDERAIQPLLEALEEDPSALVREAAAKALGRIRSPNALSELDTARTDDESQDVRYAAAWALNRYTLDELADALLTAVSADDRATAAKILGERGNPNAIVALIQALDDLEESVREAALAALEEMGTLQSLESGNSLLSHSGGVSIVPGTTTQQSSGLPHIPVLVIDGAGDTDFLRTSVGDVYTGARWLSNRGENIEYQRNSDISHVGTPGTPFTQFDSLSPDEPTVRPASGETYVPTGIVPTGNILETVSVDGIFRPHSATFLIDSRLRRYSLTNRAPIFDDAVLREAIPSPDVQVELPDSVPDRVHELARQITAGHTSAYAKAKEIERYLSQTYTYRLADESTPPIPAGWDPVDWFLFESREGTCGNYSSAFVVLAQSIGLPARVLSGFMITPTEDEQIVFADQAHQRAEIAFEGLGWISFEPTSAGQGAPGRAQEYYDSGESSGQEEETEFDRLTEQLGSADSDTAEAARSALESLGADIYHTETGGSVIRDSQSGRIAFPPGTTTEQASSGNDFAVFSVTGAKRTEYLMTATGDVYEDGQWQQLDPVFVDNNPSGPITKLVRNDMERGRAPWDTLPDSRIEHLLLAPDFDDYDNVHLDRIRVAALTSDGWIPAGVVPVSRHLNLMEREGVYSPYSGIFSMNEPAHGYQWWSIVPRLSRDDLDRADVVDDSTYLQLPADMPRRIRELAEDITDGKRTPYAKAKALERYLKTRFTYVFEDESTAPPRPAGQDPVDWFLFESQEGTCGNFSSAFVLLARSIGLPARVAAGWLIDARRESQDVKFNQAHQWAEVAFEDYGWITFEPTAPGSARTRLDLPDPDEITFGGLGFDDSRDSSNTGPVVIDAGPRVFLTVTDLTRWPSEVVRGEPFTIGGIVETQGGVPVSGMEVEIFVNEVKANGGLRVGSGMVENGRYTIEVSIPPAVDRGKYQLIAHAIGTETHIESWSDPDIAVFSKSGLVLSGPQEVDVGTAAVFRGQVTEDTGDGVEGIPLTLVIDGRSLPQQRTGADGSFSFANTFLVPGNHWAEVRFSDSDFLRANSARLNLEAVMPTTLTLDAPVQARVDEPFTVTGSLVDVRGRPLTGNQVTLAMGETEEATVTIGVDGSFTHEFTLPDSGQVTVAATFEREHHILGSSASANILARHITVLSFEGPREALFGDTVTFLGTVTSPTAEELEPLMVEIVDGAGEVVTTIQTGEGGAFSYDPGSLEETGPRTLTARVPEQEFLTYSAASISFSVVHPTALSLDGPPIAMVGQHIEFSGSLLQGDGQPIPEASLLIGGDPVITSEDGTFSHVITMPENLGGAAIEERIGIAYEFEGTDHFASASGSRSVIVGVPRLTAELVAPIARGDVAHVRGAAFTGTRPLPDAAVTLTGGHADETGSSGQFLFEYQVSPNTPIGPLRLTAELAELGVRTPIELEIRSATHMVAMPLEDVRPGRVVEVQAALYDDTGVGISGANLRTSTGLTLITDQFGQAMFELTVPESESLLAVPVTFTYTGDRHHMPLNYFLGIPVTPPSFNWLLWVVLPAFLLIFGSGGFGAYRLRAAGTPLNPRRWSVSGIQAVAEPVSPESDDFEPLPEPLETVMELTIGGPGAETGTVFGLNEEISITGKLIAEDDAPVQDRIIELREPLGDVAMFDTDESGEFHLVLRADERGEFSLSAQFEGDSFYLRSSASAAYRIVDFREEMVRIFGEFMEWATSLDVGIAGQSPRETESILVAAGVPIDQRALDELVTRFEEADYSEHEIARRHYEAMYRAWRTVVGE